MPSVAAHFFDQDIDDFDSRKLQTISKRSASFSDTETLIWSEARAVDVDARFHRNLHFIGSKHSKALAGLREVVREGTLDL
jgi:hypothetical protein